MSDPYRHSMRSFACKQVLWTDYVHIAHTFDCSVDFLIAEAMKRFARDLLPRRSIHVPPRPATLAVYYAGARYEIVKDRFIIGRGKRSCDLTIRDPNVSREHAMVERIGGISYLVDMGSTNGTEHASRRIDRRPVVNGDVFTLCDHQLRFAYE